MVEIAIIECDKLLFNRRLDAEFYKPSYQEPYKAFGKLHKRYTLVKLPNLITVQVKTGSTPNSEERIPKLDGSDVMFIKTDSVRKGFIDYDTTDLLPLEQHKRMKSTALKYMDVVVTVVGATHEIVARAGLFLKNIEANINQSDARIRVDTNKIEAGYLSTFINSKYGRTQLWRYSGQTGQVTLNCREVEELQILMLDDKLREKIHNTVLESENLREKSKQIYKEAQEILIKTLEIDKAKINDEHIFYTNLSKIKKGVRLDAEYYNPKYEKLLIHLKNDLDAKELSSIVNLKKGVEVGGNEYLEEGIPFIRVSNIS